jgi:hypothetical protein
MLDNLGIRNFVSGSAFRAGLCAVALAAAAVALPAEEALAGACGGGPLFTPDQMAVHMVLDINDGSSDSLDFVQAQLDQNLSRALPAPALAAEWQEYAQSRGTLQGEGSPVVEEAREGTHSVVQVPLQFADGQGLAVFVFNRDMTVHTVTFVSGSGDAS